MTRYRIGLTARTDLAAVLAVQHEAFSRVAADLSIDPSRLPPLQEGLSDLETLYDSGTRFWSATTKSATVGAVRATETAPGVVHVGRLVVASDHLRQGVANSLMDALEAHWPRACAFELFTGVDAHAPLGLYLARGYRETHVDSSGPVDLVWLAKPGPGALP